MKRIVSFFIGLLVLVGLGTTLLAQVQVPPAKVSANRRDVLAHLVPGAGTTFLDCHNKKGSIPSADWYSTTLGSTSPIYNLPTAGCADNDTISVYVVQGSSSTTVPTFSNANLASGTPALVQQSTAANNGGGATTVSSNALSGVVAGHTLTALWAEDSASFNPSSISGGCTSSWTWCPSGWIISGTVEAGIGYCTNATGGSTTVTVTLGGSETQVISTQEWSNASGGLDLCGAGSTGSSTAVVTGSSGSASGINDLYVALGYITSSSTWSAPSNSFTALNTSTGSGVSLAGAYLINTGSQSSGWTAGTTGNWAGGIIALKASGTAASNVIGSTCWAMPASTGDYQLWTFKWDQANQKWRGFCGGAVHSGVALPFTVAMGGTNASVLAATYQNVVASPTAANSTSAFTMQGLAGSITPTTSGNILVTINGYVTSTVTTVNTGVKLQLAYGTGTAPTSNAAATGTVVGSNPTIATLDVAATAAADVNIPFSVSGVITGLTVGTTYWLDLQAEAVTTVSADPLKNVNISAVEMN